jgi:hypothetical protein
MQAMADAWKFQMARIRSLHLDLARVDPDAPPSAPAEHGASKRAISTAERKVRRRLPPSYRAFLGEADGWAGFFEGADLLGTEELGRPRYGEMVRTAFDAYASLRAAGPESRSEGAIAFGCDNAGQVVFAFNPSVVRPDGEMEVVAWMYSFGYRFESFADFLGMVADLLQAEVESGSALVRKSA